MTLQPAYLFKKIKAMSLLVFNQREAALAEFDAMLSVDPGDRYAMASRAHVLAQLGDKPAALDALQDLVARHPDNAAAWFNLAYMIEDASGSAQAEEAEMAFRRALAIEPKMDRAWYGLSLLLIRERRFDEAVETLRKNTELQPMSPFGWYQLARVHVDRQEPEEAAKVIRHLRKFEPKVAAQLVRETGLGAGPSST
jgi:predicted Zn-dependent protease